MGKSFGSSHLVRRTFGSLASGPDYPDLGEFKKCITENVIQMILTFDFKIFDSWTHGPGQQSVSINMDGYNLELKQCVHDNLLLIYSHNHL